VFTKHLDIKLDLYHYCECKTIDKEQELFSKLLVWEDDSSTDKIVLNIISFMLLSREMSEDGFTETGSSSGTYIIKLTRVDINLWSCWNMPPLYKEDWLHCCTSRSDLVVKLVLTFVSIQGYC